MGIRLTLVLVLIANPVIGQISLDLALAGFEDDLSTPITPELNDVLKGFNNLPEVSDTTELDDILSGFDDHQVNVPDINDYHQETPPERFRFGGKLSQGIIINFAHDTGSSGAIHHRGLSSLRTRLDLEIDMNPILDWRARMTGHIWFDPATGKRGSSAYPFEIHNQEAELGEAFVQGSITDSIDLTLGRQIVVWGRSDQFRVNDILNPIDNRLPGMTDIKDLRLPVTMARFDFYTESWNTSIILVPERRFDKTPLPGSDFYTGATTPPLRDYPRSRFGRPDIAMALTGTYPGWDISFYTARVFDSRPYIKKITDVGLRRRHNRITMIGMAGNAVFGSWLLKAEAALYKHLRFTNNMEREFSRITLLAGVENTSIADTVLAMEVVNSRILDFDKSLTNPPDDRRRNEPAMAFRTSRSYLHDSLDITLAAVAFGPAGKNGSIQRLQVAYELSDGLELNGGVVFYSSGDQAPFRNIGNNDRVYLGLEYHF